MGSSYGDIFENEPSQMSPYIRLTLSNNDPW